MKTIGLLVLAAGVALSASYGARLAPDVSVELATAKKAKVLKGAAADAKKAYCKARLVEKLPHNENCLSDEEKEKREAEAMKKAEEAKKAAKDKPKEKKKPVAKKKEAPEPAKLRADAEAAYAAVEATRDADATGEAAKAQDVWMAVEKAIIEPSVAAALVKPTEPGLRVSQWFSQSGVPFLGGLLLVFIGAIIGRRAVKAEATGTGKKGGAQAIDLGQVLGKLSADMQALADSMGEAPTDGQMTEIKTRLEALQFEAFQPIVDARGRAQVRFGIASYAELYGPFSSAERRANRAWSAIVDRHWPEARDSVRIAAQQLVEAEQILERLIARG